MASSGKKRILVADVEIRNIATMIGALKDDYHVVTAGNGEEVFKQLAKNSIDMILLEANLPDMDGFEVCRRLKADELTEEIPVIFITNLNRVAAEEKGFEVGAVDYITKPFNAPTVKARIKNQLTLSTAIKELKILNKLALDANPNTGLPGNNSILNELQRAVETDAAVSVIYADLDNFKVYNDNYGFAKGDEVISFTANVIKVALQVTGCADSFLGHIGGDDFVIVLPAGKCVPVAEEIIQRIDQGILEFYTAEDIARGNIIATDRGGKERKHPLISLSLGAVDLTRRKITTALEIVDICTETKKAAKIRPGSNLFIDQRRTS